MVYIRIHNDFQAPQRIALQGFGSRVSMYSPFTPPYVSICMHVFIGSGTLEPLQKPCFCLGTLIALINFML